MACACALWMDRPVCAYPGSPATRPTAQAASPAAPATAAPTTAAPPGGVVKFLLVRGPQKVVDAGHGAVELQRVQVAAARDLPRLGWVRQVMLELARKRGGVGGGVHDDVLAVHQGVRRGRKHFVDKHQRAAQHGFKEPKVALPAEIQRKGQRECRDRQACGCWCVGQTWLCNKRGCVLMQATSGCVAQRAIAYQWLGLQVTTTRAARMVAK